ncbi:MAG: cytidylate kinase [Sulfitobacter sp.]|jgi:cytidylate kinase
MNIPVIAIDGPSGSGKGAITHRLANYLGFHILDSGAFYRLIGLGARSQSIPFSAEPQLAALAANLDVEFRSTDDSEEPIRIYLDGADVTFDLRTDQAGSDASKVAPLSSVRDAIKARQQDFRRAPGLIADGRDMGTIVFPTADLKIYLTATAEARAERRYKQLIDKGINVSLHDLFLSIQERDERDMNRKVAPLVPAQDAHVIDSTDLGIEAVFAEVLALSQVALQKDVKD